MRLAAAHLPVLCVLFALHDARATSENPPTRRSLYCDGQGPAERVGFDMACPAYAIPETLNSETKPATNCSSLFDAYPVAPDGPYWLRHPVTGAVERKWCLFGDGLGPRTDAGRTEITFITPKGYGAGLTPMSFGSVVDFWSSGRMLRYPDDDWRAWRDTGYVATDAIPLPSWSEGALGTLSVNVGMIEFTADAPVIVRMHNTVKIDNLDWLNALDDLDLWRERFDLVWCNAWRCAPNNDENSLNTHVRWYRVYERYFPAGTHALDTDDAAYQFFTPAVGVSKESDQPAELESAVAAHPPPTTYATPTVTVAAPGYGAGLTQYDFGSSVDFWSSGLMLRYPDDDWRAWRDTGYVATDAIPLPSWSENALGTLSVNVGMIEFTTDAPVIVRMYNTVMIQNWDWLNALDDLDLWRERFDLVWCNAWRCAPNNDENSLHIPFYEVFERYFPAGTHALDTDDAAYQFFKPADGTLPGTEQPAELESAAYIVETAATTAYDTPTVTVAAPGYGAGLTEYDFGSSVDLWATGRMLRYRDDGWRAWRDTGYVATDADPLPSWSENALGTLSVNVGMIEFTTDAPVIVRMYNTVMNDLNWLNAIHDLELWRERFDLNWCNAWLCAPNNDEHNLKSVVRSYEVFERYFPAGTHILDTDDAAYQFFKPADGTLPGMEQPAELDSAAYIVETAAPTTYDTPNVTVSNSTPSAYTLDSWRVNVTLNVTMSPDSLSLYVGTDATPLPSWSENALGTLSVNVGTIEFTTDAPVIVRMYNTRKIIIDEQVAWSNALDDLDLWRERFDLVWCNAWACAPNNDENNMYSRYYQVFERYFPAGTHALDTDDAAYQFFKPADGTLPGTEQPAELESAAKPNLNPHLSPYSCASDQGRVVFSLVDDNEVKDLPDTAAEIAAGFYNPNAYYIGNAELETIDIKSAKMCLERSKARGDSECITNCVDIVDSLFSCSPGSVSSSGTKNMIIALTGQLEPNTCDEFYDQGTGCDSSSTYCWSCHRTVKLGQTSSYNWHAHGYGMNLHRTGVSDELFHYPGQECSEVFENGETFWDSFYIVVQE